MIRTSLLLLFGALVGGPAILATIWVLDQAAGTSWALPVAAMVILAGFLIDFGAGREERRPRRNAFTSHNKKGVA